MAKGDEANWTEMAPEPMVTRAYLPRDVISPSSDSNDVLISLNVAP